MMPGRRQQPDYTDSVNCTSPHRTDARRLGGILLGAIVTVCIGGGGWTQTLAEPRTVPPRPGRDDVVDIRANFCNLKDSKGRVIFGPTITGLPDDERAEWYAKQREAGSTHCVLTPGNPGVAPYEGSIPMLKLVDKPQEFRKFVLEALRTTSASGKGFCPIIILDEGEGEGSPRQRMDRYWPALIDAIRDLLDYVIVVPGWELIKASPWTSTDYSYALGKLHGLRVVHLWAHFSPNRWAGSSNPVEKDDPWRGDAAGFWKSSGGEFLEGILYQSDPLRDGSNPNCDPASTRCWLNGWTFGVTRLGTGSDGWRKVRICLFESIAHTYYRGQASGELGRDMATAAQKVAQRHGVSVGFGNGLPR
jgi:hypothetical protein